MSIFALFCFEEQSNGISILNHTMNLGTTPYRIGYALFPEISKLQFFDCGPVGLFSFGFHWLI
jgi:hypothetical protein